MTEAVRREDTRNAGEVQLAISSVFVDVLPVCGVKVSWSRRSIGEISLKGRRREEEEALEGNS